MTDDPSRAGHGLSRQVDAMYIPMRCSADMPRAQVFKGVLPPIRCTTDQRQAAQRLADAAGQSLSDYIRDRMVTERGLDLKDMAKIIIARPDLEPTLRELLELRARLSDADTPVPASLRASASATGKKSASAVKSRRRT